MSIDSLTSDPMEALLRSRGITPTRQRLEIARVLLARKQHLAADEILARADRERHGISKATVYNTLKLFVDKGLAREVIVDPTRVFYDSNVEPHHHLFDVERNQLQDIDAQGISVSGLPELPDGMTALGVDVIVRVRSEAGRG